MKLAKKITNYFSKKLLTNEERTELQEQRQERAIDAEIATKIQRSRRQFKISKYNQLKQIGSVEATIPEKKSKNKNDGYIYLRNPGYKGTEFQFNQEGLPTTYPFQEVEEWTKYEAEEVYGICSDHLYFRHSDDLNMLLGWSPVSLGLGGQFPREMMPGSMSSIRQMYGQDLLRFQSKVMFETISPYSGAVNHLINYCVGDKGSLITATSKKYPELANEITEYLKYWCKKINLAKKLKQCCNELLVQGETFPRRWLDGRVTLTDPSWIRGPHNEIGQNPWAYGILSPNWPYEIETVAAFHIWYPDNTHENVSPFELFHGKLDTSVQPSSKRSVPLSYKIRPLLPIMESLIQSMGLGETKRQRICGVTYTEGADPDYLRQKSRKGCGPLNHLSEESMELFDFNGGSVFNPVYDEPTGFYHLDGAKYEAPPTSSQSENAVIAYNKLATVCANATGIAPWMYGADVEEASRATTLTASEPTVKTGKRIQATLSELFNDIAKTELILNPDLQYPVELLENDICLTVDLPNVEVRNMLELYELLHNMQVDGNLSPQTATSEMGYSFEDQRELIDIAKDKWAWEPPMQGNDVKNGDELNKIEN